MINATSCAIQQAVNIHRARWHSQLLQSTTTRGTWNKCWARSFHIITNPRKRPILTLDRSKLVKFRQKPFDISGLGNVSIYSPFMEKRKSPKIGATSSRKTNSNTEAKSNVSKTHTISDRNMTGKSASTVNNSSNVSPKSTSPDMLADVIRYTQTTGTPFPPNTFGVFYYHHPPNTPDLAAEVRFRVCNFIDAQGFKAGRDLLDVTGSRPWYLPLYFIMKNQWLRDVFVPLLVRDNLLPEKAVSDIEKLPVARMKRNECLYYFQQPFVVDLSKKRVNLTFITQKALRTFKVYNIFRVAEKGVSGYRQLYNGLCRVRFVPSPPAKSKSSPSSTTTKSKIASPITGVSLQFLEHMTPVIPADSPNTTPSILNKQRMAPPLPGTLLTRYSVTGKPKIWAYKLRPNGHGSTFPDALMEFVEETKEYAGPGLEPIEFHN